jgi:hypothetical protein
MLVPLSDCIIAEQHADIWFLGSEGVKPSEIQRIMLLKYGENCIMKGRHLLP